MVNLIWLNILAGFLHLSSAVVFMILKKQTFLVTTQIDYQTWTCNDLNNTCVITQDRRDALKLDGIWLIGIFSLISACFHFLAVVFAEFYISNISQGINIIRWIEYSISAPIMIIVIALVNGVTSLQTLILIFFTTSTVMLIGYIQELFDSSRYPTSTRLSPHLIGWIPYIAVWIVIFITFGTSVSYSPSKPPEFVYAIVFTLFALFTTFGLNQSLYIFGAIESYETSETIYVILSLVSKLTLSWMLFQGMLMR